MVLLLVVGCVGLPDGFFVLLGTQRTGTTWVMSELRKNACILTESELMINRGKHHWDLTPRRVCLGMMYGVRERSAESERLCSEKFRRFLGTSEAFSAKNNASGLSAVTGFKWMQSVERDWEWLAPLWVSAGVKLVTLRRKDHLRTVLSRVSNRATGTSHPDLKTAALIGSKKVRLETAKGKLVKHLKVVEKSYHELETFHTRASKRGIPANIGAGAHKVSTFEALRISRVSEVPEYSGVQQSSVRG